jgi:hypothetical protein
MSPAPKRRWFQFSLRTLLLVMLVACLGLAPIAYEQHKAIRQQAAVAAIQKLGGRVEYDRSLPSRSAWLRVLLGDDSYRNATGLDLSQTQVTDADLEYVRELPQLRWLAVSETMATDAGLAHLSGLTRLQNLNLGETQVTDAGLVHLHRLLQLRVLSVQRTPVTESGVTSLQGLLPNLHVNH